MKAYVKFQFGGIDYVTTSEPPKVVPIEEAVNNTELINQIKENMGISLDEVPAVNPTKFMSFSSGIFVVGTFEFNGKTYNYDSIRNGIEATEVGGSETEGVAEPKAEVKEEPKAEAAEAVEEPKAEPKEEAVAEEPKAEVKEETVAEEPKETEKVESVEVNTEPVEVDPQAKHNANISVKARPFPEVPPTITTQSESMEDTEDTKDTDDTNGVEDAEGVDVPEAKESEKTSTMSGVKVSKNPRNKLKITIGGSVRTNIFLNPPKKTRIPKKNIAPKNREEPDVPKVSADEVAQEYSDATDTSNTSSPKDINVEVKNIKQPVKVKAKQNKSSEVKSIEIPEDEEEKQEVERKLKATSENLVPPTVVTKEDLVTEAMEYASNDILKDVDPEEIERLKKIPIILFGQISEFTNSAVDLEVLVRDGEAYCKENRWHYYEGWYCIDSIANNNRYFYNEHHKIATTVSYRVRNAWKTLNR